MNKKLQQDGIKSPFTLNLTLAEKFCQHLTDQLVMIKRQQAISVIAVKLEKQYRKTNFASIQKILAIFTCFKTTKA